ncbi:MAG TPA: AAA family ATPase, partial [Candidatus Deferrimicrobiaceae bacterium]
VAIARALVNDPSTLIADEPTAHLDSRLSREFMEIVRELGRNGKTVIIASHDPLVWESEGVAAVLPMRDGRLLREEAR